MLCYFKRKNQKAASVVEYAILLMLMAVLAVPIGLSMAGSNKNTFDEGNMKLAGVLPGFFPGVGDGRETDDESCPLGHYSFYNFDIRMEYDFWEGSVFSYDQEAVPSGAAFITDTANGRPGEFFTDDDGGEIAVGDFMLGDVRAYGLSADAERVWTLRDTVSGDEFQAVQLDIGNVVFPGFYTLSEMAFVPGREYEIIYYSATPNAMSDDMAFKYADFQGYCPLF